LSIVVTKMNIRSNYMTNICRNPGNSKGFTYFFVPLYTPYTHFLSVDICYTHLLIPSVMYQSRAEEVYDLLIMYYNRKIMHKVAHTIAKHVKYTHMHVAHIS
jgi:hypothetical protein